MNAKVSPNRSAFLAVAILGLLLPALPTQAGFENNSLSVSTNNLQFVSQLGGVSYAVEVVGDTAFLGVGPRMLIFDVGDPTNPIQLGSTTRLPNFVQQISIAGTHAFIANRNGGLRIFDISTLANPLEVGVIAANSDVRDVVVVGNLAYFVDGSALRIYNVSNPASPTLVGSLTLVGKTLNGIAHSGNLVYLGAASAGLTIVDVSTPATPLERGSLDLATVNGVVTGLEVAGDYAYLSAGQEGLVIMDIQDPDNPDWVSGTVAASYSYHLDVVGDLVYVCSGFSDLRIYNVTDPANPSFVGVQVVPGYAFDVDVEGIYAHIADSYRGLQISNISNPATPAPTGATNLVQQPQAVAVSGDYVYTGDFTRMFHIVDVANPAAPLQLGSYRATGEINDLAVDGSYAYVCTGGSLTMLDVTDPDNPGLADTYPLGADCNGVFLLDKLAYVAAGSSGLVIVDVSDPANPLLEGSLGGLGTARDIFVVGDFAYLVTEASGLRVIDISTPGTPSLEGTSAVTGYPMGVTVAGDYAYVSTLSPNGLRVVDVSNPASPAEVASVGNTSFKDVAVAGALAFIASYDLGFSVASLANPALPVILESYNIPGDTLKVALSGSFQYLAHNTGGLVILSYQPYHTFMPLAVK